MTVPEVFRDNTISALIGAAITYVLTKVLAKTKRLRYSTKMDRLALSADDPVFGAVRVQWVGRDVRNLYMASVEVENCSNQDFEDVDLKVYVGPGTLLLNEHTAIVNTPYPVLWSEEYKVFLEVAPGAAPTDQQWKTYNFNREYRLPVFNRGQLLQFTYLCTRPNDDQQPGIWVGTQLKGTKLREEVRSNAIFEVPIRTALIRGLVIAILTIIACGFYVRSVWLATLVSMVVGLTASLLGAAEYKAERWLLKLIAG